MLRHVSSAANIASLEDLFSLAAPGRRSAVAASYRVALCVASLHQHKAAECTRKWQSQRHSQEIFCGALITGDSDSGGALCWTGLRGDLHSESHAFSSWHPLRALRNALPDHHAAQSLGLSSLEISTLHHTVSLHCPHDHHSAPSFPTELHLSVSSSVTRCPQLICAFAVSTSHVSTAPSTGIPSPAATMMAASMSGMNTSHLHFAATTQQRHQPPVVVICTCGAKDFKRGAIAALPEQQKWLDKVQLMETQKIKSEDPLSSSDYTPTARKRSWWRRLLGKGPKCICRRQSPVTTISIEENKPVCIRIPDEYVGVVSVLVAGKRVPYTRDMVRTRRDNLTPLRAIPEDKCHTAPYVSSLVIDE